MNCTIGVVPVPKPADKALGGGAIGRRTISNHHRGDRFYHGHNDALTVAMSSGSGFQTWTLCSRSFSFALLLYLLTLLMLRRLYTKKSEYA